MTSLTFAVSKGGVGKSLLTANVGAALAEQGKKTVLVEGDPNQPLQKILGITFSSEDARLDDVLTKKSDIAKAMYSTSVSNLYLLPSGASLQSYFDIDPIAFARILAGLKADFTIIDVPFPLGKAAFISLGVSEFFVPVLTEDEFVLCVESAIDTIRLGKYLLKSTPIGFVFNKIKTPAKFTKEFLSDLEGLLEIPCIEQIREDLKVSKSYGGVGTEKAFLAYSELQGSDFTRSIDKIASFLLDEAPKFGKKDAVKLLGDVTGSTKS